ncbi:hypothetical protein [Amycolatopsis nigrescens]|uniref:hypothetical protein n=1 Tax=Amycolatopsis nigrescens TaxID=381445 RepID=UPI00036A34F7|nr:hypothetical protein [Amycolatopsis nigrescens]
MNTQESKRLRSAPLEVKVTLALLVGCGLAYTLLGVLVLTTSEASWRSLLVPLTSLLLGLVAAGGLVLRMPSSRYAGFAVVSLFAVVHAFLLLGSELLWFKLFSLLAAAGYIYAGVLLNSMPVRRYVLGERA